MTDDLVVRLQAAIEQQVKDALSISAGRFVEGMAGRQVDPELSRYLDTVADPDAVIRMCQSHRDVLELHAGAHECRVMVEGVYPPDWNPTWPYGKPGEKWRHSTSEYFEADQRCPTVAALARGYGLEA